MTTREWMLRRRFGRPRRALIVVCVVAAVTLLAVLGSEAVSTTLAQRRTVEGVLRDYAALAAGQYARSASAALSYECLLPLLSMLDEPGDGDLRPPASDGLVQGARGRYRVDELADAFFELDLGSGRVTVSIPSGSTDGAIDRDALRARIESDVDDYQAPFGFVFDIESRPARALVYRLAEDADAGDGVARGFRTAPGVLERFLADALDDYPLLPESLTGGDGDGLATILVAGPDGRVIFRSDDELAGGLAAQTTLASRLDDLTVRAAIRPDSADRLVIGGLPRSRLPAIAGTLLLALGLLLAAAELARRERDLMRVREEFVAGASHELRTPLAQIRMSTETLRLDRVRSEDERGRYLDILDRETRRLSFLVENLLQFSRSGRRPELAAEDTDVARLATEVVNELAPMSAARGARILVRGDDEVRARVDRSSIRQVVSNLVDNATKYGPRGQVVTVEVRGEGGTITLAVEDQGPGIPVAYRERIWERFWRAPDAHGRTGTGIGLGLVREQVRSHGGAVAVEDADGGGARFVVRLPRGGDR